MGIIKTNWKNHAAAGFSYRYFINKEERTIACEIKVNSNFIYDSSFHKYLSTKISKATKFSDIVVRYKSRRIFSGKAKLSPGDEWNEKKGKDIAYRRACLKLAKQRHKILCQLIAEFNNVLDVVYKLQNIQSNRVFNVGKELNDLERD